MIEGSSRPEGIGLGEVYLIANWPRLKTLPGLISQEKDSNAQSKVGNSTVANGMCFASGNVCRKSYYSKPPPLFETGPGTLQKPIQKIARLSLAEFLVPAVQFS